MAVGLACWFMESELSTSAVCLADSPRGVGVHSSERRLAMKLRLLDRKVRGQLCMRLKRGHFEGAGGAEWAANARRTLRSWEASMKRLKVSHIPNSLKGII